MNRLLSDHLGSTEEMTDGSESNLPTKTGGKEPFDGSNGSTMAEPFCSIEEKNDRRNGISCIKSLISSERHVNWVTGSFLFISSNTHVE